MAIDCLANSVYLPDKSETMGPFMLSGHSTRQLSAKDPPDPDSFRRRGDCHMVAVDVAAYAKAHFEKFG